MSTPLESETSSAESIPLATPNDILLPDSESAESDIVWVVKPGSTVQAGEIVATIGAFTTTSQTPTSLSTSKAESKPATKIIRAKKRGRATLKRKVAEICKGDDDQPKPHPLTQSKSVDVKETVKEEKAIDPIARFKSNFKPRDDINKTTCHSNTSTKLSTRGVATPIRAGVSGFVRKYDSPLKCKKSDHEFGIMIGSIEPCTHPAVIDGLCVVCGETITNQPMKSGPPTQSSKSGVNSSNPHSSIKPQRDTLTLSGGVDFRISSDYAEDLGGHSSRILQKSRKLNLILDLDHTLLHATSDHRAAEWKDKRDDVHTIVLSATEGQDIFNRSTPPQQHAPIMKHYIKLRPHLAEFIINVMDQYEISIYTAGTRNYANSIADVIARHVLDYQDRPGPSTEPTKNTENECNCCLDEEDLIALRRETTRLQTIHQNQRKKQIDEDKTNAISTKESDDRNYQEETSQSNKKRKKVTFGALPKNDVQVDRMEEMIGQLQGVENREKRAMTLRQRIFGSRIISRTDVADLGRDVKSLKRVFPCGGMLAAIVDDREDVWANAENNNEPPGNMLLVRPYHWSEFMNYADVNNAAGEDVVGNKGNKDDTDKQLLWTGDILRRLHKRYYNDSISLEERNSLTVPSLLKIMRREVLGNNRVHLLLSGLVPLHKQKREWGINHPRPAIIRYAEELGAKVLFDVSDQLTHVVAARDGTDKILRARKIPGCFVLKVTWLMECFWSLSCRSVLSHLMGNPLMIPVVKPIENSTGFIGIGSENAGEKDDDEDDFFDELEKEISLEE